MELEFFASCLAGAEAPLAEELRSLGIDRVRPLKGGVAFFCSAEGAYEACLWSRLASRIVLVLDRVAAPDAESLYQGIHDLAWEDILTPGIPFTVRAHGTNSQLRNTRFTALKAKDAIADRLREHPRDGMESDDERRAAIDLRIHGQRATVSLDLCGEALNHRPYLLDDDAQDAPQQCTLAALALALARWPQAAALGVPLVDPVCADGIMLAEAVSVACDRAPALGRQKWGFFGWREFDGSLWQALADQARSRFEAGLRRCGASPDAQAPDPQRVRFIGTSTSSPSIARARKHMRNAGLRAVVSVELGDGPAMAEVVRRAGACGNRSADAPYFVATDLAGRLREDAEASLRTDEATVMAACRAAGDRAVVVAVDGPDLAVRFPEDAREVFPVGQGRSEAQIEVFRGPGAEAPMIEVIDLDTGVARTIEVYEATSDQFAARLRKVFKERRKEAQRKNISCYRIYDYDLPEYAVAIDWYQGAGSARGNSYLSIAEYGAPASVDEGRARRRFADVLAIAPIICGVRPDHVFARRRQRAKGGGQYRRSQGRSYVTTVEEGGFLFEVDLAKRLDTGLFLDHRDTRRLLQDKAEGAHFLNLFAYTGAATVYAAGGGARTTTTVDLSQTYLDWAARNMEANGFSGPAHRFQKADVLKWVTQARRSGRRYDLIFVDPPTFSNSKAMGKKTWDVQRDHAELLIGVSRLLAPDGVAVFSCNLRNFKPDLQKLQKYGVALEDITPDTIPFDFLRTPKIHHCYLMRRLKAK